MLNIFSTKKGAIIKITYGCNHKCSFCHERDNIFSLDFRNIFLTDLDLVYSWIIDNEFDYVIISGGEPTLHPQLVDIILYFQHRGIYVVIVNNGSHLHKHDFSQVDINKITFYISYHGLENEYNEITSSSDFSVVTKNIHELSQIFPEVILRYVVNNKNIQRFSEYSDFVLQTFPNVYLEYVMIEDLRFDHVVDTQVSLYDFYRLVFMYIKNDRVLLDGGAACVSPYLFQRAETIFDPLVNTMNGLVQKNKKNEVLFSIKQSVSSENIKSYWSKCKKCIKYEHCHGFDVDYTRTKIYGEKMTRHRIDEHL